QPFSVVTTFGPWLGLALSLALFAGIAWFTTKVERRAHGLPERRDFSPGVAFDGDPATPRWLRGPWPLVAGAIGLALVNIATLGIAGRPWGVTSGFALWGAKAAATVGMDVASWPYWTAPAQAASLQRPVVADATSVMNF